MKRYRWLMALCIGLALVPGVSRADDDDDDRAPLRLVWYSIGAGGGVSTGHGLRIEGVAGEPGATGSSHGDSWVVVAGWMPDWDGNRDRDRDALARDRGVDDATSTASLRGEVLSTGVAISFAPSLATPLARMTLERSTASEGPWGEVSFERRDRSSRIVMVDAGATMDRTWYYRVRFTAVGTVETIAGPIAVSAGTTIREFSLAPIYPNPSRGVANVAWEIPRDARVRVTVHDVQGRQVTVLADGAFPAGRHAIKWDSRSGTGRAEPGLYFVRLQTPDRMFVRRVVMAP